jgi:hypothetical protein
MLTIKSQPSRDIRVEHVLCTQHIIFVFTLKEEMLYFIALTFARQNDITDMKLRPVVLNGYMKTLYKYVTVIFVA